MLSTKEMKTEIIVLGKKYINSIFTCWKSKRNTKNAGFKSKTFPVQMKGIRPEALTFLLPADAACLSAEYSQHFQF